MLIKKAVILAAIFAAPAAFGGSVAPVSLSGPEVVKMDWNTRSLSCADIDSDGRNDLAMIDNDTGKIEILFQNNPDNPRHKERKSVQRNRWEPILEDAMFWHNSITMGTAGHDMALGDLNGDGRTDVVYTGNLTALTIRYQDEKGLWEKSWTYNTFSPQPWDKTVKIADINADGRNDIVVLGAEDFLIFYQNADGRMQDPKRYKMASSGAGSLILIDVNNDKLPDAIYLCGTDRYRRLSLRVQESAGVFGPELGFPLPNGSASLSVVREGPVPAFAVIDGQTRAILTFSINQGKVLPTSLETMQMRDYAIGATGKQTNLLTWGDFDNDKDTDIAIANPAGAEIRLFRQAANGRFEEAKAYPSLSKISSISTLQTKGAPDRILVTSSTEDIAGIVEYNEQGRLSFPEPLPTVGKPVCITAGHFTNKATESIAILEKREEDFYLTRLEKSDDSKAWSRASSVKINNVKRKPESMTTVPGGADGKDLLLVFAMKEAARIYVSGEAGFNEIATDSPIRMSCMNGIDANNIGSADVDNDGTDEMLIASNGFVRALKLKADGQLEVVDQYNSKNTNADIKGPIFVSLGKDEPDELLFFDNTEGRFELLAKDSKDGIYRSIETKDNNAQTGFSDLVNLPLGKKAGNAILAISQERIGIVPLSQPGWDKTQYLPSYETELDDVNYTTLTTGDLNNDSIPEIIATDGADNLIEILQNNNDAGFQSLMHFVVFNQNQHANARSSNALEPRELLIDDLNNDGLNDIAVLVHDRVLIYTNDAASTATETKPVVEQSK